MRTHTPGPWHCGTFREIGKAPGIDIGAENNSNVALIHHQPSDRSSAETKANARLIAAAPELLEALRLIMTNSAPGSVNTICRADLDRARRAIAKAEGR